MPKKKPNQPKARPPGKPPVKPQPGVGPQRLNKILAASGLGSRREVEELIVQGRVVVDRETITDLAFKTDPKTATIKVDGQILKAFRPVYFALNKPKGVLSTNKDPSGRTRVVDFVPDNDRVFSVGRLDKSSEGLMLLTNDGELAQRLAHPKFRVQKTYFVVVSGLMSKEELATLRKGVYLSEGFARIDGATIRKQRKGCTELEIALSEGKNREIRRILARAGHKVVVLRRIAIGTLRLGQLPVGATRKLTQTEIAALYRATEAGPQKKTAKKKAPNGDGRRSKPSGGRGELAAKSADKPSGTATRAIKAPAKQTVRDDAFSFLDEASDDKVVDELTRPKRSGLVLGDDDKRSKKRPTKNKTAKKPPAKRASSDRASARNSAKGAGKRSGATRKNTKPARASVKKGRGAKSGSTRSNSARPTKGKRGAGKRR